MVLGKHLIRHYSSTQATISLSSGEAELHGIAKAASYGIGLRSLMRDLGYALEVEILSDAVAAIGIARRRGVGNIRHLDTTDLWIQERIKAGDLRVTKVAGVSNPMDLFTNYSSRPEMEKRLTFLEVVKAEGRAVSAPKISTEQKQVQA